MYTFDFERPTELADASRLAAVDGAKVLAGGQTLLASMKLRFSNPERLIDLGAIAELAGVRRDGDAFVVGAMTRHADVASNAELQAALPALSDLAAGIGDRQVRTLGTLGGSVANNDPAACYPAALLALGATVNTTRRSIEADDFFQGMFSTALEEGELIVSASFPIPVCAAYLKFKQSASRFALIGVCVARTMDGVRVAFTGGGNGVERHAGLEQALNARFTPEAAAEVKVASDGLSSDLHASAEYRANLIGVLAQRAVAKSLG